MTKRRKQQVAISRTGAPFGRPQFVGDVPVFRLAGLRHWHSWAGEDFDLRLMRRVLGLPQTNSNDFDTSEIAFERNITEIDTAMVLHGMTPRRLWMAYTRLAAPQPSNASLFAIPNLRMAAGT